MRPGKARELLGPVTVSKHGLFFPSPAGKADAGLSRKHTWEPQTTGAALPRGARPKQECERLCPTAILAEVWPLGCGETAELTPPERKQRGWRLRHGLISAHKTPPVS